MSERYVADDSMPVISYGPRGDRDGYTLAVTTDDGERVEITLDKRAMYELWLEVRGVPWPERDDDCDRSIRQLLHYANGAKKERVEKAIDVLVGGKPGDRP